MSTQKDQDVARPITQSNQPPAPHHIRRPWYRRWWVWVIGGVLVLVLLGGGGCLVWASTAAAPMPEALAALQSDALVTVSQEPSISFTPASGAPPTGFIFYPGGHVNPHAYAPVARAIAEQGYPAFIVPMPLNLAVLGSDRAADVIVAHPEIERWVIGGHSLGGTWRPPSSTGPRTRSTAWSCGPPFRRRATISRTWQGLQRPASTARWMDLRRPRRCLRGGPAAGGRTIRAHRWRQPRQFGWYGDQPGDNPATISHADQQAAAVGATLTVLDGVEAQQP